ALISLAVAQERWFPAFSNLRPGEEGQLGGTPVPLHETLQLTAIPGFNLRYEHVLDAFFSIRAELFQGFLLGSAGLRRVLRGFRLFFHRRNRVGGLSHET